MATEDSAAVAVPAARHFARWSDRWDALRRPHHARHVGWRRRLKASAPVASYAFAADTRTSACFRHFRSLLGVDPVALSSAVTTRRPLLIFAAEQAVLRYATLALVRWIAGRPTFGVIDRAASLVVSRRPRHRLQRLMLKWIRHLPWCRMIAMVPHTAGPSLAAIAEDWIYDPRLWALTDAECDAIEALRRDRPVPERPIVMFLGRHGLAQGFHHFADLYTRRDDLGARFQFIACGPVDVACAAYKAAFEEANGVVVDRVLPAAESLGVLAATDALWCVGRMLDDIDTCRAIQLGIPIVVAYGSTLHRFAIVENIRHIAIGPNPETALAHVALPPTDGERGRELAERFREATERKLRGMFGIS